MRPLLAPLEQRVSFPKGDLGQPTAATSRPPATPFLQLQFRLKVKSLNGKAT
jgi:hypothetical protein